MKKATKKKEKGRELFFNVIGWYGALATLGAYLLISFAILKPFDIRYQILNLSGAIGLGLLCYYKRAYQPLFVNIIWAIIAALALVYIIRIVAPS